MPGQFSNPLERPNRFASVQIATDLLGYPVGEAKPGRGQRIGGSADPLGQIQILDRPGQIVNDAPPGGAGDQVQRQPATELDRMMVVRDVGASGKRVCLLEPPHPRGFLCLS